MLAAVAIIAGNHPNSARWPAIAGCVDTTALLLLLLLVLLLLLSTSLACTLG
jgi:hypothetical protein